MVLGDPRAFSCEDWGATMGRVFILFEERYQLGRDEGGRWMDGGEATIRGVRAGERPDVRDEDG